MSGLEQLGRLLVHELDDEPRREGLLDTPKRYAAFFAEFLAPPPFSPTVFDGEGYDEMIIQRNIPFYSLCEHHILPFFGVGTIAYLPGDKILGLSKLARSLEYFSRALQNQERLTMQVASFIEETIDPKGVAIVLRARHLCMEMRGVNRPGVETTTSCIKGRFETDSGTRNELLRFIS